MEWFIICMFALAGAALIKAKDSGSHAYFSTAQTQRGLITYGHGPSSVVLSSRNRSLPSLTSLAAFESASRQQSFTRAAAELGITQAAVSRQIKSLEDDLNVKLFVRAHRRVQLTQAGQGLATAVQSAFSGLVAAVEVLRRPVSANTVTIGASLALSHFWILPRLAHFRAVHPEIKLRLVAEDSPSDFRSNQLDVILGYGPGVLDLGQSIASQADIVFPVCSPDLLERLDVEPETADISQMPLIVTEVVDPAWLTWQSWAKQVGLGHGIAKAADTSRLRFNHYTDSIQIALQGEGVALGWSLLLSDYLAAGSLVPVSQYRLLTEEKYHVVVPRAGQTSDLSTVFARWLAEQFGQTRQHASFGDVSL